MFGQPMVEVGAPTTVPYLPAEQSVQLDGPAVSWYDPAGQLEHAVAMAAEYCPVEQLEQAIEVMTYGLALDDTAT